MERPEAAAMPPGLTWNAFRGEYARLHPGTPMAEVGEAWQEYSKPPLAGLPLELQQRIFARTSLPQVHALQVMSRGTARGSDRRLQELCATPPSAREWLSLVASGELEYPVAIWTAAGTAVAILEAAKRGFWRGFVVRRFSLKQQGVIFPTIEEEAETPEMTGDESFAREFLAKQAGAWLSRELPADLQSVAGLFRRRGSCRERDAEEATRQLALALAARYIIRTLRRMPLPTPAEAKRFLMEEDPGLTLLRLDHSPAVKHWLGGFLRLCLLATVVSADPGPARLGRETSSYIAEQHEHDVEEYNEVGPVNQRVLQLLAYLRDALRRDEA
jgi:hypothetical protein